MANESRNKKFLNVTSSNFQKINPATIKKSHIPLRKISSDDCGRRRAILEFGKCKNNFSFASRSQDSLINSTNMTYIPFDILLSVILKEKDACIQDLTDKLSKCNCELHHGLNGLEAYNPNDVNEIIRKDAEVIALKSRIASLEAELEEHKLSFNNLTNDVNALKDENRHLLAKLKNAEKIIEDFKQSNAGLVSDTEYNLDKFQTKIVTLEKDELFQVKNEEIVKLKAQDSQDFMQQTEEYIKSPIRELDDEHDSKAAVEKLKRLKDENIELKKGIGELEWYEKEMNQLKKTIKELEVVVKNMNSENKQLKNKIQDLEQLQHSDCQRREDCSENETNGKELVLDEKFSHVKSEDENEIQRLKLKIKFLNSKLQKSFIDLQAERNRVEHVQNKMNLALAEKIKLNAKAITVQAQNNLVLKERDSELLKNHFEPVFEMQEQIALLVNAYEKEDAMSCEEMQDFLHSSKKIIAFVLSNMIEYLREMEDLRIDNQVMKEELEDLKNDFSRMDVEELLEQIDRLNSVIRDKDLKIEEVRLSKKELFEEVDELKDLNKKLKILNDTLKAENYFIKQELKNGGSDWLRREVDRLLVEIERLNGEVDMLTMNYVRNQGKEDYDYAIEKMKDDLIVLKKENELMNKLLGEKDKELELVNKELGGLRECLKNSGGEQLKIQEELSMLNKKHKMLENKFLKFMGEINKMDDIIGAQVEIINEQKEDFDMFNCKSKEEEKLLKKIKNFDYSLNKNIESLENIISGKDVEIENLKIVSKKYLDDMIEMPKVDYEKFIAEKNALESALQHLGKEFVDLKKELDNMKKLKEETVKLKAERDELLKKIAQSEIEIENLKAKFSDCCVLKNKLAKLKPIETALEKKIAELSALSSQKESAKSKEILKLNEKLAENVSEMSRLKLENEMLKNALEDLRRALEERRKTGMKSSGSSSASFYSARCPSDPESPRNYRKLLQQVEDRNSHKLAVLIQQHEKEMKARDKIFNEAVNCIKSNYESDIRKLVEKHKGSILRLQGLHEDEIQELNTNYETQMEEMQTQHEKILKELKSSSGEKIKELMDKHNNDVKDLEGKYQRILHEKETQHMFQLSKLQLKLSSNVGEVEEYRLDSELRGNMDRKKLKKTNMKRLEMMTSKYEELLKKERKKYEEKLKAVLDSINKDDLKGLNFQFTGYSNTEFPDMEIYYSKNDFNMTFHNQDFSYLAQGFSPSDPTIPTPEAFENFQLSPVKSSKEELLHKIIILENKMETNRMEMQNAVANVERLSTTRIQELKNLLCDERRKNSDMQVLLVNFSKKYEEDIGERTKEIEKQKAEKRNLEEDLLKQKETVKHLQENVKSLKEKFKNQRRKDLEYIESMRVRLEQELDSERK